MENVGGGNLREYIKKERSGSNSVGIEGVFWRWEISVAPTGAGKREGNLCTHD